MSIPKTLAVLTGGGDVPGLNPCIKQIVNRAVEHGWRVLGFRRGWAGPLNFNPDEPDDHGAWVTELNNQVVRTIDRTGGTFLHTSRTQPSHVKARDVPLILRDPGIDYDSSTETFDLTWKVLKTLDHLGVDVLIPIGGDDTLGYGARIHKEGYPVVSVPKTMDNDVFGTDFCIGFSTAITRSVDLITALRTPTGSHERIAVVEHDGVLLPEIPSVANEVSEVKKITVVYTYSYMDGNRERTVRDREVFLRTRYEQ